MVILQALVELLSEKGVLNWKEVHERVEGLRRRLVD
jgi:hypothetical protein